MQKLWTRYIKIWVVVKSLKHCITYSLGDWGFFLSPITIFTLFGSRVLVVRQLKTMRKLWLVRQSLARQMYVFCISKKVPWCQPCVGCMVFCRFFYSLLLPSALWLTPSRQIVWIPAGQIWLLLTGQMLMVGSLCLLQRHAVDLPHRRRQPLYVHDT